MCLPQERSCIQQKCIDWLVVYLPLWKMMEFVSWDDDIPNIWKVTKLMFETTNQISISLVWIAMGCKPRQPIMLGVDLHTPKKHAEIAVICYQMLSLFLGLDFAIKYPKYPSWRVVPFLDIAKPPQIMFAWWYIPMILSLILIISSVIISLNIPLHNINNWDLATWHISSIQLRPGYEMSMMNWASVNHRGILTPGLLKIGGAICNTQWSHINVHLWFIICFGSLVSFIQGALINRRSTLLFWGKPLAGYHILWVFFIQARQKSHV